MIIKNMENCLKGVFMDTKYLWEQIGTFSIWGLGFYFFYVHNYIVSIIYMIMAIFMTVMIVRCYHQDKYIEDWRKKLRK